MAERGEPAREDRICRGSPDQRSEFERDRDRVLYTDALRRLAGVTQVAGAAEGHLFHNRLTHTLKVAQIARRLAEKLLAENATLVEEWGGLSPDVVEAAALIHDLGHPPFGHIAEVELDILARDHGDPEGFEGNAQSFRIVTKLAAHRDPALSDGYAGINLTRATLNAALKYPWVRDTRHPKSKQYLKFGAYRSEASELEFARKLGPTDNAQCLEAAIMDYADDVAYSVHDLEDFFRAGLVPIVVLAQSEEAFTKYVERWKGELRSGITPSEVDEQRDALLSMLRDLFPFDGQYNDRFEHRAALRTATSNLIATYVKAVSIAPRLAGRPLDVPLAARVQLKFLQRLVWTYVIENPRLTTQQHGQRHIIRSLFQIYLTAVKGRDAALVPPLFHRGLTALGDARAADARMQDTAEETRLAVDIVASLSDDQAILLYRRLTGISTGSVTDYVSA